MRGDTEAVERVRASGNILLGRLSRSDQALIEPHAEAVTVDCGSPLLVPDDPLDAVFFPGTALVSLQEGAELRHRVEIAVVGREGMLGWAGLLGSDRSCHLAMVRMRPGTLLRVPLPPLRLACARSPSLQAALLQFVHVMIVQMSRAISSGLQHSLDQRLARWLLMRHDRVGGDLLTVHHDEIAESMNVRRASVTDWLHVLEGERLLRCTRGRIVVRDRGGLEAFAGEAYGAAEAQYRLLIAPFGKSVPVKAHQLH